MTLSVILNTVIESIINIMLAPTFKLILGSLVIRINSRLSIVHVGVNPSESFVFQSKYIYLNLPQENKK